MGNAVKSRIHNTAIRPIMTYAVETRHETTKTRRILETTEINKVRKVAGKHCWIEKQADIFNECAKKYILKIYLVLWIM